MSTRHPLIALVLVLAGSSGCSYWSVMPQLGTRVAGTDGSGWGFRSVGLMAWDDSARFTGDALLTPAIGGGIVVYDWGSRGSATVGASFSFPLDGSDLTGFVRPQLAIEAGSLDAPESDVTYGIGLEVEAGVYWRLADDGWGLELSVGCAADVTNYDRADGAQCTIALGPAFGR